MMNKQIFKKQMKSGKKVLNHINHHPNQSKHPKSSLKASKNINNHKLDNNKNLEYHPLNSHKENTTMKNNQIFQELLGIINTEYAQELQSIKIEPYYHEQSVQEQSNAEKSKTKKQYEQNNKNRMTTNIFKLIQQQQNDESLKLQYEDYLTQEHNNHQENQQQQSTKQIKLTQSQVKQVQKQKERIFKKSSLFKQENNPNNYEIKSKTLSLRQKQDNQLKVDKEKNKNNKVLKKQENKNISLINISKIQETRTLQSTNKKVADQFFNNPEQIPEEKYAKSHKILSKADRVQSTQVGHQERGFQKHRNGYHVQQNGGYHKHSQMGRPHISYTESYNKGDILDDLRQKIGTQSQSTNSSHSYYNSVLLKKQKKEDQNHQLQSVKLGDKILQGIIARAGRKYLS